MCYCKSRKWCYTLDSKFNDVYSQCKAIGMPVRAYWYLYALNVQQARNEANIFVSRLKESEKRDK
nr:GH25 family lysozyme [Miniphocaeibacter halophilus]